jgi:hypothetical protein
MHIARKRVVERGILISSYSFYRLKAEKSANISSRSERNLRQKGGLQGSR